MKKLLLAILSLTFCFCLALTMPFSASANEQNAEIFTETKVQISTNGDKMLVVTGIKDVSLIYQLGYEINGTDYVGVDGDTAETDKYYEGLTLGDVTKTASEMFDGAVGLLVWEIAYDSSLSYDIVPYAYLGEIVDGSFKVPQNPEKSYGTEKESFNTFNVTFKNEDGSIISDTSVNYGGKVTEPNAPYKGFYTFDGWYVGETEYNFDSAVTSNLELTAKYVESDTLVYSVENGNIMGIANVLNNNGTLSVGSHKFNNATTAKNVLVYNYTGAGTSAAGNHNIGLTLDFDYAIKLYDYTTFKITFGKTVTATNDKGVVQSQPTLAVYANGTTELYSYYHQSNSVTVDIKALAEEKELTEINSLELSVIYWAYVTECNVYVSSIELVKAEKVDVNFVDEDGNPISSKTINAGETIVAPEVEEKDGFIFDGWYLGEDKFDFETAIIESITLVAKYTEIVETKYTVQVLAARYAQNYVSGYYMPGGLSYVDKTSDYASVLGLDSNNQATGYVGDSVDLTEKLATLRGAKVNAESVVSGTIIENEGLTLTVKLDFDEETLGFGMDDIKIGEWSCDGLVFALEYKLGVCGLNITGTIGNGKELHIALGEVDLTSYASYSLDYYEKTEKDIEVAVVDNNDAISSYSTIKLTANTTDYKDGTTDIISKFPSATTIKTIRVKILGGGTKDVFITGIAKIEYVKKTVTYSVANGNIMDVVKPLNGGTLSMTEKELVYTYQGDTINANHMAGVVIDLGPIKVSDYKTIKISAEAKRINGNNANFGYVFCDTYTKEEIVSKYGGVQTIDIISACNGKATVFNTLEISAQNYLNAPDYVLKITSIVLELAD